MEKLICTIIVLLVLPVSAAFGQTETTGQPDNTLQTCKKMMKNSSGQVQNIQPAVSPSSFSNSGITADSIQPVSVNNGNDTLPDGNLQSCKSFLHSPLNPSQPDKQNISLVNTTLSDTASSSSNDILPTQQLQSHRSLMRPFGQPHPVQSRTGNQ